MSQFPLFSCGLELANLVVASDLLHSSWAAISNLRRETDPNQQPSLLVRFKDYPQPPNYTIIAFVTSPPCDKHYLQEEGDLVSSPRFEFLCTKNNPSFSIHKAAITRFESLHDELSLLKDQLGNSTQLIITGHSLGGSIASLFTLWLLESINSSTTKRPLCITFGSPFIGDNGLQQAILQSPAWSSCFLHLASNQDPVPRFFMSPKTPHVDDSSSQSIVYKPFGTFLLCSESGYACFADPESILELLAATHLENSGSQDPNEGLQVVDYGFILNHLKPRVLFKGISELGERITHPLRAGIVTQLEAIGVARTQNIESNTLIAKMEKGEKIQKRKDVSPSTKLSKIKVNMLHLEWYKKLSKAQGIGYYDSYKNMQSKSDIEVVRYKKILTNYWKDMVAEVERKPQRKGSTFQFRWLYAGTNYRRMVEPLDIADYYRDSKHGLKDYHTQGRSEHYILLEQWHNDEERRSNQYRDVHKRNSACTLTEDSCFWAYVEDAIVSCKLLKSGESSHEKKESSRERLIEFECYVMDLIGNYAVNPEIFSEQSSFMQWWREYKKIVEASYISPLIDYMKNNKYLQYA